MNDPCTLKDCNYCDGTYYPFDTHCSFCGHETYEKDLSLCKVCNKEIYGTFSEWKQHKKSHEVIQN